MRNLSQRKDCVFDEVVDSGEQKRTGSGDGERGQQYARRRPDQEVLENVVARTRPAFGGCKSEQPAYARLDAFRFLITKQKNPSRHRRPRTLGNVSGNL